MKKKWKGVIFMLQYFIPTLRRSMSSLSRKVKIKIIKIIMIKFRTDYEFNCNHGRELSFKN